MRVAPEEADGAHMLRQRYIYILPTRYGFLYAATLMAMLLGSLNYASNLGLMYTFLLAGLGLVCMLLTWRNLLGLRIREGNATPVFAGQEAAFVVEFENLDRRPRFGLDAETRRGPGGRLDLPPRGRRGVQLCMPTEKRGKLCLLRVKVSTCYPMGLFRAWSYLDLGSCCVVYPRPAASGQPAYAAADQHSTPRSGYQGAGEDDFQGLRRYREGDSPRQIDWKAVARDRGVLSKEFGSEQASLLWLDWDALPGYLGVEDRLRLLCRFVLDADAVGRIYGLRLPGRRLTPGSGPGQRHRCLAALASYSQGG